LRVGGISPWILGRLRTHSAATLAAAALVFPVPATRRRSSLSISLADNQDGFICHSFAGDDPIHCKDYVREKLGLPAFKPTNGKAKKAGPEIDISSSLNGVDWLAQFQKKAAEQQQNYNGKVVATYDYKDSDGNLLYQNCRLEPKDFRQRRPDGKGWNWSLAGLEGRRVLYRLPELLSLPDATAFVCEGEKDTDNVIKLGYCATTVASHKWTNECINALAGRDCWILEDNDEAGRKNAIDAATALHGTAKSIRIIQLPGLSEGGDISDWLDAGHTAAELEEVCYNTPEWKSGADRKIDATATKYQPPDDVGGKILQFPPRTEAKAPELGIPHSDKRTVILLEAGQLHIAASEAEAALITAGLPLYARGGEIVRPVIEDVKGFRGRKTKTARLKALNIDSMRDHLSRAVQFRKYAGRTTVDVDPPHQIAATILTRDGDWILPPLSGLITTPTLRPDGSILSTEGYDSATKLLLVAPPTMPAIPDEPTVDDASAALKCLDALLTEFPFVDQESHAVALSALMTPVARGAMQVVPMHVTTAPEAGTGKSYIIDLAAVIATGEVAPVIAAGRNEEETEKRLAAQLLTAQPIVSIDNLNGDLGGDFICQAIERPIIKPRILGRSETRHIENTVTLFGNGNNIRLCGDIVRRVVVCSLDANMERPELRKFTGNPVATVLADRGKYIAAVLTILRAYLCAGSPSTCDPFASFEEWSRLIRASLVWLDRADPVATTEKARSDDPTRGNLQAVVAAWQNIFGVGYDQRITAGKLVETALLAGEKEADLNKALTAVATRPGRNEIEPGQLGRWLGRNKGRVTGNAKIQGEIDRHTKQVMWWLK
jgi:hypothetical protein